MSYQRDLSRPSVDPLCELMDEMLMDATAANVSSETARAVRALRHSAEYAIMAAEMLLEGSRSGRIVSPEQALSWAAAKLAEAWDGTNILIPASWPEYGPEGV